MPVTPTTMPALVSALVERVAARPAAERVRVVVDGAPATAPADLADALVAPLRAAGRDVARVSADSFWRPASIRLEHGRHDAISYLEDWLDEGALVREVLAPFGVGGSGRYLPSLWDAERDRATRAPYEQAPAGAVVVVDGSMLLGRGLPFDLSVHLAVRPATLVRRTPPESAWTLEAFDLYESRATPTLAADVVVRVDDPRHPALVDR
ncbi:nucleoside/nucleotide kinase family protein [Cellulomonas edaphi]|uniref:Uridine kinase n=1 Tax=Cellulomonas edaphi TaxID=3053468 RepID=A0ABT7S5W0_9CELL|nr:uridine kinase [Cellulomons edaphi]MDM7831003.1 uridine kinase [Cellulomons edaphi]